MAMQHGKIIIQEAWTVIQYTGSYVILLTSRFRQLLAQCLHSVGFVERCYYVYKRF